MKNVVSAEPTGVSSPPDLFLAFKEGLHAGRTCRCTMIKRFAIAEQDDLMLVKVDLATVPDSEWSQLILVPRWAEVSLSDVGTWPADVNVLLPTVPISSTQSSLNVEETAFVSIGVLRLATDEAAEQIRYGTIRPLPR